MSVPLIINGITFNYPVQFDKNWGPTLTNWSTAVTNALKPLTGGFLTLSPFPSTGINFANATNTGFISLTINGSNQLTFNGVPIAASSSLTDNNFFIGNGSNIPTPHLLSGDVTTTNTGVVTISAGAITNSKIAASTGITLTKLAALTASIVPITDGSGFLIASATTTTELGYVHGVTSSIQTQLNTLTTNQANYLPLAGGTMSGPISMASNKITGLTAGSNAGEVVAYQQLHYTQTPIQTVTTVQSSTTSSTFAAVTNLSATIIPTSSLHKIKITCSIPLLVSGNSNGFITIKRDTTDLGGVSNTGFAEVGSPTTDIRTACHITYIDAPGDTSSHTYQVFIRNDNGNTTRVNDQPSKAVIILEEVI